MKLTKVEVDRRICGGGVRIFLGLDSFSIHFSHRSFQEAAISPGFWAVF